ncbi:EpsG family protein [Dysgonomonas termitidis]|uniref:EpsG family protein n=1 Tax=Dysgonomonas termitidis TaxID=1516126 RepID=A0ABV9KW36_9BACT
MNYLVFALIIIAVLESFSGKLFNPEIRGVNNIIGIIIVIVVIIYMGLRPVSSVFGDTQAYAISFHRLQLSDSQFHILNDGEWVFNTIMFWFAKNGNIHTFFLFCSTVYVGTLWWALVRIFKEDYLIPFIVAIGMFTFWSYGVNGVRNGMAASIIILAFTFRQNPVWLVILCFLGAGIHNSMYLTLAAGGVAFFAKDSKIYLSIWLACILISLISGNLFADMIAGSNLIEDDRFASYIAGDNTQSVFSNKGFRWDFLLYSSIPVAAGYYFIFKEKYTDIFYIWLFNIYLMTNAFWIIIIRASFSNRFAQISWFLMPLILIYPFFMKKFWNDQSVKIGYIVIISYSYTFYLTFIK